MSDPQPKTLYLVDGTAQLFRAYFAIRGLANESGMPTNAVYGFTTMLRKLLREESPPLVGVAFDLPGPVFRHQRYEDYKANRPPAPEDLDVQVPWAKQVCQVLGIAVLEHQGFEADDLIAAYARLARKEDCRVVIVSSDKDLFQLVGEGVTQIDPARGEPPLDARGVEERFGVPPQSVRDVIGLMGDAVDNIPGVPGVGEKTAVSIVKMYGDLEGVLDRATRFTGLYDARDAVLALLDKGGRAAGRSMSAAITDLLRAIERFAEKETDQAARERISGLSRLLSGAPAGDLASRLEEESAEARKLRRELKRFLKAIDRGSSKRIWYAIREHADQARMSRELATLDAEAPLAHRLDELKVGAPDRRRAEALFRSLGFRSLTEEFAVDSEADSGAGPAEPAERGSYEAVLDSGRLRELSAKWGRAERLAVDTETDGVDPLRARLVGLSLSDREGHGVYVPLDHDYEDAPQQISLSEVREILGPVLADRRVAKVGQNLKFDAHVLRRYGLEVEGWVLDTMVAAFLINPSRSGYAMDSLAQEFLGYTPMSYEEIAGQGARQRTLNEVEIDRVAVYAAEDADVTLRLASVLRSRLVDAGLARVYDEMDGPLLPLLVRMEAWGIGVDAEKLGRMSRQMDHDLERAREKIHALAGESFNIDSPKQLREVLFDKLELKTRRRTAKGRLPSTDAQTLRELAAKHPIAGQVLGYRELAKLKGTYVDALPKLIHPETHRVHTCFHPTGAATGRLSSSDPNLQNIPARSEAGRRIRSAFVPADGFVFLASDYSQVELRVLAHLARDAELIAAFRGGEDIHRHTASKLFGVPIAKVTTEMRRRAKAVNFGVLYGMSESRLAREQGTTLAEAREFVERYFDRFSAVRGYIDAVRERALRDGAVRTMFERVRYFPQLRGSAGRAAREQALRAAVNTTIQGTAADLMKMAMLRVDRALSRSRSAARMLLQVHDELLLEVPRDEIDEVGRLVRSEMEQVHALDAPLVVDQKVGKNWQEVT